MPSPDGLYTDVVASIAAEVREEVSTEATSKEEVQPGESWTAEAWLKRHKVAQAVASAILKPLAELDGDSAAELAFFRAFSQRGSRDMLLMLLLDGKVAEMIADSLWPSFVELAQPGAASASELHAKFAEIDKSIQELEAQELSPDGTPDRWEALTDLRAQRERFEQRLARMSWREGVEQREQPRAPVQHRHHRRHRRRRAFGIPPDAQPGHARASS